MRITSRNGSHRTIVIHLMRDCLEIQVCGSRLPLRQAFSFSFSFFFFLKALTCQTLHLFISESKDADES